MNIAGRLKEGRLAKGLTQKEVANLIGSNQQNITSYEKGRSHPPLDVLKTFIELYELDPYVLLELEPQPWNKIPVYSMRSEGKAFFMPKNIVGYEFTDIEKADEHFCIRVKGNSMALYRLLDGDTVFLRRQHAASNGDLVLASLDQHTHVLRLYKETENGFFLMSPDVAVQDTFVPLDKDGKIPESIQIRGVVKRVLFDYENPFREGRCST
ncbi:MAG: XRE family transcriptional regulator [Bacillota bacterium]|nr:XRE family transcriptional regulator [Bacillota bacterium]MDW7678247.1 XRE family transcriptional regulator [Bacillota bacterium]